MATVGNLIKRQRLELLRLFRLWNFFNSRQSSIFYFQVDFIRTLCIVGIYLTEHHILKVPLNQWKLSIINKERKKEYHKII